MSTAARLEGWLARQSDHPLRWFAATAILLAVQISPWWLPTPDSAAYLSIARSIATDHSLRMFGYLHSAYPPGYPFLISPAFWLGPEPFLAISMLQCLMALLLMWGLYRWLAEQTADGALFLTLLVMVNVTLWTYYHRPLSELAFATTALWAVLTLDRSLDRAAGRVRIGLLLLGTALLVLLTLIREAGVLFAFALGATVMLRLRQRTIKASTAIAAIAIVLLPALAAVIGFVIYTQVTFATTHVFGTHLSGLFNNPVPLARRLSNGLRLQIDGVGRLLVPGMFKAYGYGWVDINTLIYSVICIPLAIGWYRWTVRRPDPYALVVPLYLLLYVIWDFAADTRYVLPLLPPLVVALWYFVEPFRRWRLTMIAVLTGLHLAVATSYWLAVELPQAHRCAGQQQLVQQLAPAVAGHAGPIITTRDVPECTRLFLALTLDRPVAVVRPNLSAIGPARILLTTAGEQRVDGFHIARTAGDYILWLADAPTAAR
jgi:hypothetical protein